MDLTSTNRAPLANAEPRAALTISREPWALAIRQKYGTGENLLRRWAPSQQRYCALRFENAFRGPEHPETVVRITRTFGEGIAQSLLCNQIAAALMEAQAQQDTTPEDIAAVAQAITDSDRLRRLALVSVLKFFHRLRCGEYEQLMFGRELSARKILTELNRQFPRLIREENAAAQAYEREQAEREAAEHLRQAVTWEQWALASGLGEADAKKGFLGFTQAREERRAAFVRFFTAISHILAVLADPLSYLDDDCAQLLPENAQDGPQGPKGAPNDKPYHQRPERPSEGRTGPK